MNVSFSDPYFNPKRARAILTGVLLMHVALIAIPLIYSSLTDYFNPPLIVMKVGLADLPPGDSPDAGTPAPANTAAAEPDPVSVDDIPDPQKVDSLPPEQNVEPPPKTKDDPKPTVKPPEVKPTVKPPEVKPAVKPPKTETKNDPPKTSNYLKPEDINKSKPSKTQAQIDAEERARKEAEERTKANAEARKRALDELLAAAGSQPGRYGTTDPGQDGVLATAEMRAYYAQLVEFIRPMWNSVSPTRGELNGSIARWPVLELDIGKDGRIRAAVVVAKSNNKRIDDAVEQLRGRLNAVPVPPQAVRIPVTLDIR